MPGIPLFHADGDFGAFKIIDVGRSFFFNNTGVTRHKVGKFGFDADRGGGLGLHQRQLIDEGGDEPIANTIWGLNTSWYKPSNFINNLLDKQPLVDTKTPSSSSIEAEFSY